MLEEVDIDIYLPYYSNPGIPAESVPDNTLIKEGFTVPPPEVLLILKQVAYEQRKATIKGQKDKIDIVSLLTLDLDFSLYRRILQETGQRELSQKLTNLLQATVRINELNLKNHQMAKLKEKVLREIV